ncbi:MAG: M48 family metalloprotease [Chloroflexia bacterium]
MEQEAQANIPGHSLVTEADPYRQAMARSYADSRRMVGVATWVLGFALSYVLINPSISLALRRWAQSVSSDPGIIVALYVLAMGGAFMLVSLPVYAWAGYYLPRKYGLATLTARAWWLDCGKVVVAGLVLWVATAEVFYWIVRANREGWWLYVAVLWWGALVLWEYLWPLNRFWGDKLVPLDDLEINRRLTKMAEQAGVRAMSVWIMPVSKRTRSTNAWLVGMGRTRRIILADTMPANFNHDELEAVLAHELAHHAHADIDRQLAIKGITILATMFAAYHVLNWFGGSQGPGGAADVATMPYLLIALAVQGVLAATVGSYLSRRAERAADRYAMELTGNPDAFKSAMIKLADLNLMETQPAGGPFEEPRTHPTIGERVRMADVVAGRPAASTASAPMPQGAGWSKRTRLMVAGAMLAPLLLVGISGVWSVSAFVLPVLRQYQNGYTGYDGPGTGPAASWPDLVASARQEALRVEEGMEIYMISAYPIDYEELHNDSVLAVSFYFQNREGKTVTVTLVDTEPPQTYYTTPTWEQGEQPTERRLESARQVLSKVRLRARGEPVYAIVEQAFYPLPGEAEPAGWRISYLADKEALDLTVEPSNGRILSRQVAPIEYYERCEEC